MARQLLAELLPRTGNRSRLDHITTIPISGLGATPDLFAENERGIGTVQIKTVAPQVFASKWHNADTGEIEPPLWAAMQAMCEQASDRRRFCRRGGGWRAGYGLSARRAAGAVSAARRRRGARQVKAFWEMIARGELPEPDYGRDAGTIARCCARTTAARST